MATIILRDAGSLSSPGSSAKGSPLTNLEVDNNFSNLNITSGVLTNLTTTAQSNLVVAINELVTSNATQNTRITLLTTNLTTTNGNIGVLSNLTTSNTSNLVSAVNEVNASSGVVASTYGGSAQIPVIVINANGRITSAANTSVTVGTAITDDTTTNATRYLTLTSVTTGSITTANVSSSKLFFNPSTGLLTSTDYNSSSDITLKDNIANIESALDTIKQLQGKSFTWKDSGARAYGLIAQEVESIIPDIVISNDGIKGINYINIIAFLIEAVKDLSSQVDQLKK
jgi:hypothetical protein